MLGAFITVAIDEFCFNLLGAINESFHFFLSHFECRKWLSNKLLHIIEKSKRVLRVKILLYIAVKTLVKITVKTGWKLHIFESWNCLKIALVENWMKAPVENLINVAITIHSNYLTCIFVSLVCEKQNMSTHKQNKTIFYYFWNWCWTYFGESIHLI